MNQYKRDRWSMLDYRGRVPEIPSSRKILFESRVAERENLE